MPNVWTAAADLVNGDFATGDGTGWTIVTGTPRYNAAGYFLGGSADALTQIEQILTIPADAKLVRFDGMAGGSNTSDYDRGSAFLEWLDGSDAHIAVGDGFHIGSQNDNPGLDEGWQVGEIPAGAVKCRVTVRADRESGGTVNNGRVDKALVEWFRGTDSVYVSANVLDNGGFETGDLTGWGEHPDLSEMGGVTTEAELVFSGTYAWGNNVSDARIIQDFHVDDMNADYAMFTGVACCTTQWDDYTKIELEIYDSSDVLLDAISTFGPSHRAAKRAFTISVPLTASVAKVRVAIRTRRLISTSGMDVSLDAMQLRFVSETGETDLKPVIKAWQPKYYGFFNRIGAQLEVDAKSTTGNALTYQWRKNTTDVAGEASATFNPTDLTLDTEKDTYDVIVGDAGHANTTQSPDCVIMEVRDANDVLLNSSLTRMQTYFHWRQVSPGSQFIASSTKVGTFWYARGGSSDAESNYSQEVYWPLWAGEDAVTGGWHMKDFADADNGWYYLSFTNETNGTFIVAEQAIAGEQANLWQQTWSGKVTIPAANILTGTFWARVRHRHERRSGTSNNSGTGRTVLSIGEPVYEQGGDELWPYTDAVFDFQGVNGATTITANLCPHSRSTWVFDGNAQLDNSQAVFGGSTSVYLDGTAGTRIRGTGMGGLINQDACQVFEFSVRFEALPTVGNFHNVWHYGVPTSTGDRLRLLVSDTGELHLYIYNNNGSRGRGIQPTAGLGLTVDTWYSFAVVVGVNFGFFVIVDGEAVCQLSTNGGAFPVAEGSGVFIGDGDTTYSPMQGWIGQLRHTFASRGSNPFSYHQKRFFATTAYDPYFNTLTKSALRGENFNDEKGFSWTPVNAVITSSTQSHPYAPNVISLTNGYIEADIGTLESAREYTPTNAPRRYDDARSSARHMTIEGWFYIPNFTQNHPIFMHGTPGSGNGLLQLYIDTSGDARILIVDAAGTQLANYSTSGEADINVVVGWNHFTYIWSQGAHLLSITQDITPSTGSAGFTMSGTLYFNPVTATAKTRWGAIQSGATVVTTVSGLLSDLRVTYGDADWKQQAAREEYLMAPARTPRAYLPNTQELADPNLPQISSQPQNTNVLDETGPATFTVAATQTDSYQWYSTVTGLIPGATNFTYSFTPVDYATNDQEGFYCELTNAFGTVQTDTAILTVDKITVVFNPDLSNKTVTEFDVVNYTVGVTAKAPFTYQWYELTGGIIVGQTGPTLEFVADYAQDGNEYWCEITDGYGDTTESTHSILTVLKLPLQIFQQPNDTTKMESDLVTIQVIATGKGVTYQWYENGILMPGETDSVLQFFADRDQDQNTYYVILMDSYGDSLQSDTITLTVLPFLSKKIVDVRVKAEDGTWVSIVGPAGDDASSGLIDDSMVRDYLTWSSQKIFDELAGKIGAVSEDPNPVLGNYLALNDKGIIHSFTVPVAVLEGDLCYLDTNGQMAIADATVDTTAATLLAVAMGDIDANDGGTFLLMGILSSDTPHGFAVGDQLYVAVGGGMTTTPPSGSGNIVRVVGYTLSQDQIYFDPDTTWMKLN